MAKLFEIFGYPVNDNSEEANGNRLAARCPFMNRDCDGGGNRELSKITLANHPELAQLYPQRQLLQAGVCSIQPILNTTPWIVCPRRLLVLGREKVGERTYQADAEQETIRLLDYPEGTILGVWTEVKYKYKEAVNDLKMTFDYTFDYVIMPTKSVSRTEIEEITGESWAKLRKVLEAGGYTIAFRNNDYFVEDFPSGKPSVIEIMTSSTSGGNKAKRTTIPASFEDAILGKDHNSPGINYRQVWARMVSQLIVKSEIAVNWQGTTLWVVQDALVNYIRATTGLDIHRFQAEATGEVNMLSFSYGDQYQNNPQGVIELTNPQLYAGPISGEISKDKNPEPGFQDIIRTPICPPISTLILKLAKRSPMNYVIAQ